MTTYELIAYAATAFIGSACGYYVMSKFVEPFDTFRKSFDEEIEALHDRCDYLHERVDMLVIPDPLDKEPPTLRPVLRTTILPPPPVPEEWPTNVYPVFMDPAKGGDDAA